MKTLSPDLQAHLDSATTTLAWCWRITRADGAAFGFTDHDRMLDFDGTRFESEAGLIPSELRQGSDLSVDAQDAEGVLSSDRITETDILDGLWDNAAVEVFRVNWQDPEQRVMLRRGSIGQIRRGRIAFVAEVRSLAHVLGQQVGRAYQSQCDAALGDARCGVDLSNPAYQGAGTVGSVERRRVISCFDLDVFTAGWFDAGTIEWTSGANAGRRAEIMLHELSGSAARLTLFAEAVNDIAPGDAFVAVAGCDKRIETCGARFNNVVYFRGFPSVPGQDAILRYATQSGGHNGRVL